MKSICKTPVNFYDNWNPLNSIGTGSSCDVLLVQDVKTSKKQVLKIFKPSIQTSFTEAEAKLLLSMKHSRIISASGYYSKVFIPTEESGSGVSQESDSLPVIVVEYLPNGDLLGLIETFGSFPETIAQAYFLQLIDAVGYIHENGICHLDIKPDNILIDKNYCLKLADFGLALKAPKDSLVKGAIGTTNYHAPEIHANKAYSPQQADLFALGITLFTMVVGMMPFASAKQSDPIYKLIAEGKFAEFWALHQKMRPNHKLVLTKSFKNLIESMFSFDEKKRLTIEEIKRHPWLQCVVPSDERIGGFMKSSVVKSTCADEVSPKKVSGKDENNMVMSSC